MCVCPCCVCPPANYSSLARTATRVWGKEKEKNKQQNKTMCNDESVAIISSVSSSIQQQKRSCIWSLWHLAEPAVALLFFLFSAREFSKSISPRQRIINWLHIYNRPKRISFFFFFVGRDFPFFKNRLQSNWQPFGIIGDITDPAVQLVRGVKPPLCCSRNNYFFKGHFHCVSHWSIVNRVS